MNIHELYSLYLQHPSVQTDTRRLQQGDLFFALKGPNFNANELAAKALDLGAAYAVIDDERFHIPGKTFLTEDVLKTLQQLAQYHRKQFTIPFLAITGSNGKTTTKELISAVLSTTLKTYTTRGNLNNHIGIPLTLLSVKKDAEIAVIEMGANHQKEIEGYCEYTMPTHGLITNCGKAHLEGFGGVEGVRKGKGELYDYLRAHQGTAFVMWDYDYLQKMSTGIPEIITYGTHDASITAVAQENGPYLSTHIISGVDLTDIPSQLVGAYNLPNILAAVAVGSYFGVKAPDIKKAIEGYTPSNSRSQLISLGNNQIILDAYNANPSSMRLAIENLASMNGGEKVLLIGAMAELGEESLEEHKTIIRLIEQFSWKAVVLVGGDFLKIPHPFISFENAEQAKDWFSQQHLEHCIILIKGSRSMQMETVLNN